MNTFNEIDIQSFWNQHPCGDSQVGGLKGDYESFFADYDKFRYDTHSHLLNCLDNIDFKNKHVLEIGLGQGADSEQIIKRGALWSGLDLTPESVARVKARLSLNKLPNEHIKQGSALNIPCEDKKFDIVFSHGVLHHIPDIQTAQREIHRVLKPNGELIIMVYARWSLNYLFSISLLRRMGLIALYALNYRPGGIFNTHLDNAKKMGLFNYLRMSNFIHRNTDGPSNPYSKVYDLKTIKEDFSDFTVIKSYKRFMHAPPIPTHALPLQKILGWHLWIHMRPKL